jgi:hypothetical protein
MENKYYYINNKKNNIKMKETKYTVVYYFNTSQGTGLRNVDLNMFESFDKAYDLFAEICQELNDQPAPRQTKSPQPLRQEGQRYIVELWMVSRINNQ